MRRVALIADIHGNAVALEAVLADIDRRGADEIVCLGDVAAGGPQPREALQRLRTRGCAVVRGNADDWLLGSVPAEDDAEKQWLRAIVEWARAQLSEPDLAYLESFVPVIELDLGRSRRLLCFHGSPRASADRLLATTPEEELARLFAGAAADVFAGGHTHLQLARRLGASLLVNPGSVGLPLAADPDSGPLPDGEPRLPRLAEYALIEAEAAISVELRRVPIDATALGRAGHRSGMPDPGWWATRLERRIARRNAKATDRGGR
ncbi:MAG: metallophosphatase family protein [Chloroflexota bacterium]|nr:metallophosphatase family protein [Chloroflexota bacterium]